MFRSLFGYGFERKCNLLITVGFATREVTLGQVRYHRSYVRAGTTEVASRDETSEDNFKRDFPVCFRTRCVKNPCID